MLHDGASQAPLWYDYYYCCLSTLRLRILRREALSRRFPQPSQLTQPRHVRLPAALRRE